MGVKLNTPVLDRYGPTSELEINDCDWPGCHCDGPHRAPRSRDEPDEFRWFCKQHAAQYNKAWNFFANLSDDEVEAIVRHDTVWNRPSWPIGTGPAVRAFMRGHFKDPFDAFEAAEGDGQRPPGEAPPTELGAAIRRALAILGLQIPVDTAAVKARYKELVKRYHPDAQGDAKHAKGVSDDRIKEINQAYTVIMEFLEA